VLVGPHRLRGHGGQVGAVRAGLVAVDLLQGEDVGVERADRGGVPVEVDLVVHRGTGVEDVEGREAHAAILPSRAPLIDRLAEADPSVHHPVPGG
jgi:hypothetical protein